MKKNFLEQVIARSAFLIFFLIVISSCGEIIDRRSFDGNYIQVPIKFASVSESDQASLKLDDDRDDQSVGRLKLSSPTAYSMTVTGCQSGFTANLTQDNRVVAILKGDQGCVVRLTSFVYNGNTYIPKSGANFNNYLVSEKATFVNQADPTDILSVKVNNQISSPVADNDTISYIFGSISAVSSASVSSSVTSQSHSISISGQEPPAFNLNSTNPPAIVFNGLNSLGAATFRFNLFCSKPMTDGSGSKTFCPTVTNSTTQGCDLSQITYKFIKDTYNVSKGERLSDSQLQTIFSSDSTSINMSTDLLTTSPYGFKTQVLTGPGALYNNPDTILILNCDNLSFQYFPISTQLPR